MNTSYQIASVGKGKYTTAYQLWIHTDPLILQALGKPHTKRSKSRTVLFGVASHYAQLRRAKTILQMGGLCTLANITAIAASAPGKTDTIHHLARSTYDDYLTVAAILAHPEPAPEDSPNNPTIAFVTKNIYLQGVNNMIIGNYERSVRIITKTANTATLLRTIIASLSEDHYKKLLTIWHDTPDRPTQLPDDITQIVSAIIPSISHIIPGDRPTR